MHVFLQANSATDTSKGYASNLIRFQTKFCLINDFTRMLSNPDTDRPIALRSTIIVASHLIQAYFGDTFSHMSLLYLYD